VSHTIQTAAQHALHLTRAFGAPLYRGFLHSLVSLFRVVVVQIRRGQVSSSVSLAGRRGRRVRESAIYM
jgi:hypothetical protein